MPPLVLDKGIIAAQVHRHRSAADRAVRHKFAWHTHIALLLDHLTNDFFVVVGFLTARLTALEQAVIALCIEQAVLVEPGFLETVIHVGSQHEIILVLHQLQKIIVDRFGGIHIAVDVGFHRPASVRACSG